MNAIHLMTTWPDCETRATNGPGREWRTLQIRVSAARKTVAISMPRRFTSRKHEHSGFAGSQGSDLQRTISQPLILGEHNPAPLADRPKPDAVLLITSEMVVVNLDNKTSLDEFRSDWVYAQRPVDEEYRLIRRLRSGSLLRWHWCPDGSPARAPRRNPRPCIARRWM